MAEHLNIAEVIGDFVTGGGEVLQKLLFKAQLVYEFMCVETNK